MRKTFFLVLVIILNISFLYSCRKKVEKDTVLANKAYHCYNNILDGDEVIIDGGGSCGSTDISIENYCGLSDNTVKLGSTTYSVVSCVKNTLTSGYYSGYIEYTITLSNGGYIKIITSPTVWYNYELSNGTGFPDESEFIITINVSPYNITSISGHLNIKTNGVNFAFESCDGYVYYASLSVKIYALYN